MNKALKHIRSLGTHNTLDGKAPGTAFADVIVFTEAIGSKLREQLAKTHKLWQCDKQKDLCIAVRLSLVEHMTNIVEHYKFLVPGRKKVSPHRGVFWITFLLHNVKHVIFCEHRINAAFPPYKRGERFWRPLMWKRHTRFIRNKIKRWIKKGCAILGGGDTNTPEGVVAWAKKGKRKWGQEVGRRLDRLFVYGYTFGAVRVMSPMGSDHHRLRAQVRDDFRLVA